MAEATTSQLQTKPHVVDNFLYVSFVSGFIFKILHDLDLDGFFRRIHWRNFQYGYKTLFFILRIIQMALCIGSFDTTARVASALFATP
jgi:hypothetical protein